MESITDFIGGGWRKEMEGVERLKTKLKELEKIAGDWNGEDDKFVSDGNVFSAEDAEVANDKAVEIRQLLNLQ
jgi:hypothetical protein